MKNRMMICFITATVMLSQCGIVFASVPERTLTWYSNASIGLPTTEEWWGIDFGDVNKDGFMDLAATRGEKDKEGLFIWLGDGTGKWTLANSSKPIAPYCGGVRFYDWNKDSNLDLGVGDWRSVPATIGKGIHLYKGDGTGKFTQVGGQLGSKKWGAVDFGDFNNDGKVDLTSGCYDKVSAWKGDGTGTWTDQSTGLPTASNYMYFNARFADIDSDGNLDIGVAGDGTGKWTDISDNLPTERCVGVAVGDINNDGYLDIGATFYRKGVQVWIRVVIPEFATILVPTFGMLALSLITVVVHPRTRRLL